MQNFWLHNLCKKDTHFREIVENSYLHKSLLKLKFGRRSFCVNFFQGNILYSILSVNQWMSDIFILESLCLSSTFIITVQVNITGNVMFLLQTCRYKPFIQCFHRFPLFLTFNICPLALIILITTAAFYLMPFFVNLVHYLFVT